MSKKRCSKCKRNKTLNNFAKGKCYKDGLHNRCRLCCKRRYESRKTDFEKRGGPDQSIKRKLCKNCKMSLPISKFGICRSSKTGYYTFCKKCSTEISIAANKKNRARIRKYERKLRRTNTRYLLRSNISRSLRKNLAKYEITKTQPTNKYGIDVEAIAKSLGPRPGKNYHIDHIFPVDAFDLTKPEHISACYSPKNLQWLLASENLKKKNRYDEKQFELFKMEHGL